jgi:hypothetical protein
VVAIALSAAAIAGGPGLPSPRALFYQSLAPLAILALIAIFLRSHLLRTAFNRGITLSTGVIIGGITLSRALGLWAGVGAAQMLTYDLLIAAIGSAVCAAVLIRALWWNVLCAMAAALLCAAFPERAMLFFSAASGIAFVWMMFFFIRRQS